jgi:GTP-binding protein
VSGSPLRLHFLTSATRLEDLPPSAAEVAFAGRSNVGKSSLINALANRRQLAAVSKTPGRTRLLNLFELEGASTESLRGTLVDLPGYGYANVPERVRQRWASMIEGYLLGRSALRKVVVLVDGEIGPTELDLQMLDWAAHHDLPLQVVATKQDKVPPSKRARRCDDLAERCGLVPDEVLWVSATKGHQIDRLRSLVRRWLR